MLFTTYSWFLLLPWLTLSKIEKCGWSIIAGIYINSTAIFNEPCIPWGGCQYVFWQVCFIGGALMTPLPFDNVLSSISLKIVDCSFSACYYTVLLWVKMVILRYVICMWLPIWNISISNYILPCVLIPWGGNSNKLWLFICTMEGSFCDI